MVVRGRMMRAKREGWEDSGKRGERWILRFKEHWEEMDNFKFEIKLKKVLLCVFCITSCLYVHACSYTVNTCLPASILCTAGATSTSVRLSQVWAWYSLTCALPCNANHTPWPYATMHVTQRLLSVPAWNQCWDGGKKCYIPVHLLTRSVFCDPHLHSPSPPLHIYTPCILPPTSCTSVVVLIIRILFCEPHQSFPPTGTILVTGLLGVPRTNVWEDWGSQKLPAGIVQGERKRKHICKWFSNAYIYIYRAGAGSNLNNMFLCLKKKETKSYHFNYHFWAKKTASHLSSLPAYLLLSDRQSPLHWPMIQRLCCPNTWRRQKRSNVEWQEVKHTMNEITYNI